MNTLTNDNANPHNSDSAIVVDLTIDAAGFKTSSVITNALQDACIDLETIDETIESVKTLQSSCDKIDYALSVGSGMLCGLIDIFLVGAPNNHSIIGETTDKWINEGVEKFAKINGWSPQQYKSTALAYLENHFKVPYDQRGCGDAGMDVFDLNPSNHHFKSLGHQPTLIGLIFSIIDQFTNQSHFVTDGQLVTLEDANGSFQLKGNSFLEKIFCGFVNWLGHLVSDVAGSSGSSSRGMGIPSPIWSWVNSLIVLKRELGISASDFDRRICDIAVEVYKQGVDLRFTISQSIPVVINELIVRLFYSLRRFIALYKSKGNRHYSWNEIWRKCKPFKDPTLTRMLTVAHGTFCALDISDATIRSFIKGGGNFNPVEFFVRLNIVGVGRFSVALYGEFKMAMNIRTAKHRANFAKKERCIIEDYINGLNELSIYYNDDNFSNFVKMVADSKNIRETFEQTGIIAEERGVNNPLKTKTDIDKYFIV